MGQLNHPLMIAKTTVVTQNAHTVLRRWFINTPHVAVKVLHMYAPMLSGTSMMHLCVVHKETLLLNRIRQFPLPLVNYGLPLFLSLPLHPVNSIQLGDYGRRTTWCRGEEQIQGHPSKSVHSTQHRICTLIHNDSSCSIWPTLTSRNSILGTTSHFCTTFPQILKQGLLSFSSLPCPTQTTSMLTTSG